MRLLRFAFAGLVCLAGWTSLGTTSGCGETEEIAPTEDSGTETSTPTGPTSCRQNEAQCGAACANLRTDPANCGACGTACTAGQVCDLGRCAAGCSAGLLQCGQSCVDTS